ncbi:protein TIFY 4B isoform X2 [Chenopodium quinoa]|uniref:protein TIFY 4B isoform X2 n=1 Tax=Chenopodium quinoa TaxID=63459 RepID=UPI000B787BD4|nr:protein TIFY 4B isoform X2 [Chenopodium quinoa]
MDSGVTATSAAAAVKSVLDKPLHELTEDDISQLTREDCRRFLKEKGMRRPSWNKSQAIQQVISLKSLLEPSPPPNAAALKSALVRPPIHPTNTVNSNSSSSIKELSPADVDGSVSALGEDGGPNQPAGTSISEPTREPECHPTAIDSKAVPVRGTDASHLPFDQMTIFYSGRVNVYDGVPIDKQAQAIMHLAASPIQFSQDDPNNGNPTHWSGPCQVPTSSVKFSVSTQDGAAAQPMMQGKMMESIQHCKSDGSLFYEQDVEGQTNRQVSLQRYFEKRKDRGKFKMKRKVESSPSGLEMYLNHQMRTSVINGQPTRNNTSPRSQLGIPCSSYGLADKDQKNHGLSVDLNDKA